MKVRYSSAFCSIKHGLQSAPPKKQNHPLRRFNSDSKVKFEEF